MSESNQACDGQRQACQNPVFIIGSPRSGTSVLAWALAQHSRVWTSGEMHILYSLLKDFTDIFRKEQSLPEGWIAKQAVSCDEFLEHLGLGINILFSSRSSGKRWVEQTPINTRITDLFARMFPGAKFLHILRDGRSVVNSMIRFYNSLDESIRDATIHGGWYPEWATDFAKACNTWKESVEIAALCCQRYPERCLTISYEQLVANPEAGFCEVMAFLDLPEERAPADYLRANRIHSSYKTSTVGAIQQQSPTDVWASWTDEQKQLFRSIAGDTLRVRVPSTRDGEWDYEELISQVRSTVRVVLPLVARVLIVSKGDDELLKLDGRQAAHFPQNTEGVYAGQHPASSDAAIEQLELLRSHGWEYLLFPRTAYWWFDHYVGFRNYLDRCYRCTWSDMNSRAYSLRESQPPAARPACVAEESA